LLAVASAGRGNHGRIALRRGFRQRSFDDQDASDAVSSPYNRPSALAATIGDGPLSSGRRTGGCGGIGRVAAEKEHQSLGLQRRGSEARRPRSRRFDSAGGATSVARTWVPWLTNVEPAVYGNRVRHWDSQLPQRISHRCQRSISRTAFGSCGAAMITTGSPTYQDSDSIRIRPDPLAFGAAEKLESPASGRPRSWRLQRVEADHRSRCA